jgi:Fe-S oxidoreductase
LLEREAEIGGCLVSKIPAWRLPRRVLDRDLSIVEALGIDVRTGVALGRDVALEDLRSEFGAILLLPGHPGGRALRNDEGCGLRRTVRDTLWADPATCETGVPGLFAGGAAVSGPCTTIEALAFGRRAAESAFRYLAGGDLVAVRDPIRPDRLLWTLEIDEAERRRRERTPVMLQPFNEPMTEEEVREEAGRCLDCSCRLCVADCEFLAQHCASPRDLARRVLSNPDDEDTLQMVYSCNLCSLCATVCPEQLDTGTMLAAARREAVRRGRAPLPQHRSTLESYKAGTGTTFRLLLSEPGRRRSKRLFFTGCALPAHSPRHTLALYDQLRRHHPGTGVLMHCCGAPAERLGMEEAFRETARYIARQVESVGAEELVTACPECRVVLSSGLPDLPVRDAWEMLAGVWHPPRQREGVEVAVHDSCVARHQPDLHAAVRALLESAGSLVRDAEYSRSRTRCCGHGGGIRAVDPALYRRISERRAGDSPLPWVSYCADCRASLHENGLPSIHLLDFLLEPELERALQAPRPGRLARFANRLRTKRAFRKLAPLGAG